MKIDECTDIQNYTLSQVLECCEIKYTISNSPISSSKTRTDFKSLASFDSFLRIHFCHSYDLLI